ncbi:MAG: glycosyltransferase [Tissierellaceae bacterium]
MGKTKVIFYLYALWGGGAERTIINIINNLSIDRYEIVLVLETIKIDEYSYLIKEHIKIHVLDSTNYQERIKNLINCINRENPDILFTTLNDNNIILALAKLIGRLKVPLVVREANTRSESGTTTFLNKLATYFFYNFIAAKVVALSQGVRDDLIQNFKIKKKKIILINNPIEINYIKKKSDEIVTDLSFSKGEKVILTVGRLVEQKDHATLLRAFRIVAKEVDVRLVILGKGKLENQLKTLLKELGIENKVIFLGFKGNPYKYMSMADIFVLSSRWEGFGHVIVEAMTVGVPVISTDCKSGPKEILGNNEYGILVPVGDYKAIAREVLVLLSDKKRHNYLRKKAYERVIDFRASKIVNQYEDLFDETIKRYSKRK